jgi:single-stranded DNA-binding protein
MQLNDHRIIGNLTKAPILKKTENGKSYCYLNLAADYGYGDKAKTIYYSATLWGKQAENAAKNLVKGQQVLVTAYVDSYIDKNKNLHYVFNAKDVSYGRKPQLSKEKDQTTEKSVPVVEESIEVPTPIEPPEEFFSDEPSEEPDMDI